MLADVAPAEVDESAGSDSLLGSFVGDDGEPDPQRVAERVVAAVAAQLGLPEGDVDTGLPLVEIGVDSIMTVGLLRQLEKQTGLSLPPTLLWEYPTAAAVSERIFRTARIARGFAGAPRSSGVLNRRGQDGASCATTFFLSTLPTAVLGSVGIGASTSGRECADTPRSSRNWFSSASVIGGPLNTTAAQIFSPR